MILHFMLYFFSRKTIKDFAAKENVYELYLKLKLLSYHSYVCNGKIAGASSSKILKREKG